MNENKFTFRKENYVLKLRKICKKNSILLHCENMNNKKTYIKDLNSEIIFGKSLDEAFNLLRERIKNNNIVIKEKIDEIIIEVNGKNKNDFIPLSLKQDNSSTTTSDDKNNYGCGNENGVEHFDQSFSDTISSIPKNTEIKVDISNLNLSIQITIPNNEILNNSCANECNALFNLIQSQNSKEKKLY